MKWTAGLLLLGLTASTGCVTLPLSWQKAKPSPAPAPALQNVEPVTADQVNADNANDKAQALRDELDRDAQAEVRGAGKPADHAGKP